MKILLVATVQSHICQFHKPLIKMLKEYGHEVHIAAKYNLDVKPRLMLDTVDKIFDVPFNRSPFSPSNVKAFRILKKIINDNKYDIIHCNTPVGGVISRFVAPRRIKVIYTAHGFHFYKGAPLKNWLMYFPIEWFLSFKTDVLITINKEDYAFAKKHLHAKRIEYVHGVGLDTEKFIKANINRSEKRKEIGITDNDFAILSVGELNDNKNHETILMAINRLNDKSIKYVICGNGDKDVYLKELAKKLGMENRLILLGYRRDIPEICKACDLFAFPSKREGLPVSVMEAMTTGLPVVCSEIRGNMDLIKTDQGGLLCASMDVIKFSENIVKLRNNNELRKKMGDNNASSVKKYDIKSVLNEMKKIYEELI